MGPLPTQKQTELATQVQLYDENMKALQQRYGSYRIKNSMEKVFEMKKSLQEYTTIFSVLKQIMDYFLQREAQNQFKYQANNFDISP